MLLHDPDDASPVRTGCRAPPPQRRWLLTFDGELPMLGRIFPETIFPRKLPPSAEKRLRLAQARAEESIIRTHVENALAFVDALAEDLPFDRAIETYVRVLGIPEPLASVVVTRALVVLGEELVPSRRAGPEAPAAEDATRPALRLDDASDGRVRAVKRA